MEPPSPDSNQPQIVLPNASPKNGKGLRWTGVFIALVLIVGIAIYLVANKDTTSAHVPITAQIHITPARLEPTTIRVKQGQSVVWINEDSAPHHIASDPFPSEDTLPELNSLEPLATGESYAFTFDKAGTYTYHDHLNPLALKGTVIVEQ